MSQVINNSTTIKLFGTTIFLTQNSTNHCSSKFAPPLPHEDFSDHSLHSSVSSSSPLDEVSQQTIVDLNTPSAETEASQQNSTTLDEQSDVSQDKSPKKPDIIVPCPRCKSMDTKFCYYNNYNVKQPRHFCKNCQRYWTCGGTARKMLVGAGRRKNKVTSNFSFDVSHYPPMSTLLTFGSNPSNITYYGGFLQPLWNVESIPTQSCGPSKPTLGKHSRDGDMINRSKASSLVLKANPTALSRSIVFHERI